MTRGEAGRGAVTEQLRAWRAGEPGAREKLLERVYPELRRVARRCMASERASHTLQPTALVHEAFLRLVDADVDWKDRAHFFAVCAGTMRRILVDHARHAGRQKRGGGVVALSLDPELAVAEAPCREVLVVDGALEELAGLDPQRAALVELYYFGGLTLEEISEVSGLSRSSAHRQLNLARAWLKRALAAAG